jgi:imidazolonepropionase
MSTALSTPALPNADGVWHHLHFAPEALGAGAAALHDGAIVVDQGSIVWTGAYIALPDMYKSWFKHDGLGAMVTPGLIDCHTHLVYGGQRSNEFAMRLAGASYEDVARAGGGIISSVKATREYSEDDLFEATAPRLTALLNEGVCAIEIKSGYGLSLEHERKQLRVARRLGESFNVTVRTTFLGAHALPPEYTGRSDDYIQMLCQEMMPTLAAEGLVDAVDAFCETIGFSLAQTERVFQTALALGLPVKLHAEQLTDMGGSALAARYGALSCDHIEHLNAEGIAAMRQAGTVAVLLPGAYYTLRDTHLPPIAALRAVGVPMAVSTDHNPGTSPSLSLLLMINMACTLFRLTVPEALAGVTRHAAQALGLEATHGRIAVSCPANFVLWPLSDISELAYWLGQRPACSVVRQGYLAVDGMALHRSNA